MGEVYRATDTNAETQRRPQSAAGGGGRRCQAAGPLPARSRTARRVSHANIAAVYGLERSGGVPALVMELVEGGSRTSSRAARFRSARRCRSPGRSPKRSRRRTTGHHPSRPEARERDAAARRHREGARLRPRQGDGLHRCDGRGHDDTGDDDRHIVVTCRRNRRGAGRWIAARMCGRSARSCSRCSPGSAPTGVTRPSPTGQPCQRRRRRRSGAPAPMPPRETRRRLDSAATVRLEIEDTLAGGDAAAGPIRGRGGGRMAAVDDRGAVDGGRGGGGGRVGALGTSTGPRRDPNRHRHPRHRRPGLVRAVARRPAHRVRGLGRRHPAPVAPLARGDDRPAAGRHRGRTQPLLVPRQPLDRLLHRHLAEAARSGRRRPRIIAPASSGAGGMWAADGFIIFAPSPSSPLMRVSASGGSTVEVTTFGPQQIGHRWPYALPDGRRFLYYAGAHRTPPASTWAPSMEAPRSA